METINSNETALQFLGAILGLVFFFAPVIIACAARVATLKLIALLLCIFAFVGTPLIIVMLPIIGTALAPIFFGTIWVAAMICGAASFMATAIQKSASDATYRLLMNDISGLPVPTSLERQQRKEGRI